MKHTFVILFSAAVLVPPAFCKEKKIEEKPENCTFGKISSDCINKEGQNGKLEAEQLRKLDDVQFRYFPIQKPFQLHEHYCHMLREIDNIRKPHRKLCEIINKRYHCRSESSKKCGVPLQIRLPEVENETAKQFYKILYEIGGQCIDWLKKPVVPVHEMYDESLCRSY